MRLLQSARKRLANFATGGELERLANSALSTGAELALTQTALKEVSREAERYKEDIGWTRQEEGQATQNRQKVRDVCRYAFQRGNPFIKGALRLMTEFCFEQGIDGPTSDDTATQDALDEFWLEPANQETLFGTVAQHRASNQLLVDGDFFTILRTGLEGDTRTAVRYMPAAYVVDPIADPFDVARVLYYKCLVPDFEWDSTANNWKEKDKKKVAFYRDILNNIPENDPLNDMLGGRAEEDAYIDHIAINAIDAGSLGWPEPAVSMPWFDLHKQIANDQGTVSSATAALMNVLKVDGSSDAIDTLRDEIRDRGQYGDGEANENVSAQINLMNQQAELSVNRASSRAGEAEVNSRMMHMAGVVGLGIPLHFSGDPDNAGLATAATMDRPALVHFRAYQSLWLDAYRKMIDFALAHRGIEDAQYDIPAPKIARQDISEAGKLIIEGFDAGLLTDNQAAASLLDMLGFDNIAKELAIRDEEMENEEESEPTMLDMDTEPVEESSW